MIAEIFRSANLSGRPLVEPYAGSASVALAMVDWGVVPTATIGEQDPMLYAFWRALFERTDELLERFFALPINLKTWGRLRPLLEVRNPGRTKDFVELGLAGLFFNRANFSGILDSGPIGGKGQKSEYTIDCRTNKEEIAARILAISALREQVQVHFGDAVELIKNHSRRSGEVFYIDPPYFVEGERLYRYFYRLRDHKRLAEAVTKLKSKWLLSYDDHHVIEFLYEEFEMRRHAFQYSANGPKRKYELLIANFTLPADLNGWKSIKPSAKARK